MIDFKKSYFQVFHGKVKIFFVEKASILSNTSKKTLSKHEIYILSGVICRRLFFKEFL